MENTHPSEPHSNVHKFSGYHPDKYDLTGISLTVRTDESLTPQRPPCLTQRTVGMYLRPLTRELDEVAPKPYIDDLSNIVIDKMLQKDKAFWVDKPGANAYTLHDAYYNYEMTTERIKPHHQDVFPHAYSYDLDCVKYRRLHACDGFKSSSQENTKPAVAYCRDCKGGETKESQSGIDNNDITLGRWRQYPNLNTKLPPEKVQELMDEVGRPFKHEACNWYYRKYPTRKFDGILRRFSK
ncbi:uncharacterized protein LOC106719749 [Papilio machaon]|uniref:uncharacterized protein LOC106719749 n=1 Tax=Papilio machaon TaxID=76193 RepID=UPI001E665742|nr:uncharacterized protein LOC106719749 [Papilio machaon]